jgi:glucose/arabinose dehydrogenase
MLQSAVLKPRTLTTLSAELLARSRSRRTFWLVGVIIHFLVRSSSSAAVETGTVVQWGADFWGQPPFGLTNIVAIRSGPFHSLGLRADGRLIGWGNDAFSQATPPTGLSNVIGMAAGQYHSLAIKKDGTVVHWGYLDPWNALVPPANLSRVAAVASGGDWNLALRSNGTVAAWGLGFYGQTNVPSGLTNVREIAAGLSHALALRSNGTVVAWGINDFGQTNVPPGLSNVVSIAAGSSNSIAILANGTIREWGMVQNTNEWSNVVRVASSSQHSLALLRDGTVKGWGTDWYGELSFPLGLTNVLEIGVGVGRSVALVKTPVVRFPPLTQTVLAGSNVSFTATAEANGPFRYYWLFNGQPLAGATNSTLLLPSVTLSNAGNYSVVVSNAFGTMQSQPAILTVLPLEITWEPPNTSAPAGQDALFELEIRSMVPCSFQWLWNNGTPIPGGTNDELVLRAVDYSQRGLYWVVVSNQYGSVTSRTAVLVVSPTWSIDDAAVVKTSGIATQMVFNVHMFGGGREEPVVLNYSTEPNSAQAGIDFTHVQSAITFSPFVTNQTITVPIPGSSSSSEPRRFLMHIYTTHGVPPYDGYIRSVADGWILKDNYTPTISLLPQSFVEGAIVNTLHLPVVLSGPATRAVTVSFTTADGSAVNGKDYMATSGQLLFASLTTTQSIPIQLLGNLVRQTNRTFAVHLSAPVNAIITNNVVPQTILDDDRMNLPPGFSVDLVATNIQGPTAFEFAPDGRLFVCQQEGDVRIVKDGTLLSAPFVQVNTSSFDFSEAGLLGLTFDPGFSNNQFVYIYYTSLSPVPHNRISRFTANGDTVLPGSEQSIVELPPLLTTIHQGGGMHFGRDGKLYLGFGESGVSANGQTLTNLYGKILRFNPDGTIPSDNPFYNTAQGQNRAIWAYGLRNPFSFSFQPGTGRMLINDVGQNTWEEINEGRSGANYGWPAAEGASGNGGYDNPVFAYGHGSGNAFGCAIIGAAFYDPPRVQFPPEYRSNYFFGDFCNGWIRRLTNGNQAADFVTGLDVVIDLKTGPDGALYCLSGYPSYGGTIFRFRYGESSRLDWIRRLPDSRLQIHGQANAVSTFVLQVSTNLVQWQPVSTNFVVGPTFDYFDSPPSGTAQRFYRLAQ